MSSRDDKRRAERIAAAFVAHHGGRDVFTSRAARFGRVDLWACDAVGLLPRGLLGIQVTTGDSSAVSARRRKLEFITWPEGARVGLMQVTRAEGRRIRYLYRVDWYVPTEGLFDAVPDRQWAGWGEWTEAPRPWWDSKA